ncbi:MAG: magnesium/cobalt transporter CorA [Kiritimatiellaeota bacterium]|nr:magnesium/cobalt transporter CorA [Kiritimatiellota bacterium]
MLRSFIFSQGKLIYQDPGLEVLRLVLYDDDVQLWVDMENPTAQENKEVLEGVFNFHPLAIEDCVTLSERPKADEYDNYIFLVVHAMNYVAGKHELTTSELNLFIGKNFLVTCHCEPLRCVMATIERVRKNAPLVARAPDRLTYHLLDALLDQYEPAMEALSTEIEQLEHRVLAAHAANHIGNVVTLKGVVQKMRQIVLPQREVIARVAHGEFKIVRAHLLPYFRDLLDRLAHINDMADNDREALTGVLQVHLNLQQMQINQIIKVLTVLATLALPILAVTSYYGMNIQHMPNTDWPPWPYAYAWILGMILLWTSLIWWWIKKKGWY